MHRSINENQLIIVDIVDVMTDYTSIQIDIDETKVKAAALVAQNVDIKRLITKVNLDRAINPATEAVQKAKDDALIELLIPPLCYFTYARCLKMFQGTFTDSGYTTETEADDRNAVKSTANEMRSIAETFMSDVIDFLEAEDPNTEATGDNITPSIRVFGGKEDRESNGS
jgi:hypothetical protein